MKKLLIGIDLGGTNVKLGLLDINGAILGRTSFPTESAKGPGDLVIRMNAQSRQLLAQCQCSMEQVICAGIGSPGPLSVDRGQLFICANLPGFDNFPIRGRLSQALGVPAVLHNDANAACWGEFWLGAGRDVTDMVMFTLGTGVGGGIICAGELVRGSEDNGAELGHLIIVPDGRLCNCGQRGCIEAYASANQTALRAEEAVRAGGSSSLQPVLDRQGSLSCKDVFDHAVAGDGMARQVVQQTARYLAQMCVNMLHVTEPQMIVFAGGMIEAGDYLLDMIRNEYLGMLWKLKTESMTLTYASLGGDAGLAGAAGLALHAWQQGKLTAVGQ